MSDNQPKSKLKRKKCVAEQQNPVADRRSVDPAAAAAAAWWSSEQLPAVETLFALTLSSVLEDQHWDPVPDLPHPSAARRSAQLLDEQPWCDLSEEVAPFPELSPLEPGPLSVSSNPQTRPLSPHSTPPGHGLTKTRRQEETSLAGPSGVRAEEGRKEERRETRKPLTHQLEIIHSRVLPQKEGDKEVVEDEDEEAMEDEEQQVQRGAAGRLLSCPMCLLEFPAGFTQMDCDGHLAQCLSDMNVDMTW